MRIAIDGYNLAMPHGTGVATYGYTLARSLRDMGHQVEGLYGLDTGREAATRELLFFEHFGHGHRLSNSKLYRRVALSTAFDWRSRRPVVVPQSERIDKRAFSYRLPPLDGLMSSPYLFEIAYARFAYLGLFTTIKLPDPLDVMHWTYPLPLRVAGAKNIYTIHDLVPLRLPHVTLDNKRHYHKLVKSCVDAADHICTVSEASRADIVDYFPRAAGKITNTYQSSPPPPEILANDPAVDAAVIEGMFGLPDKGYFLFFGAADPKKNLGRIVNAYMMANVSTPLVIVTSRDWGMNDETRMLGKGGRVYGRQMRNRIIRLEYLPKAVLFRLIRTARAVLCPSLFEGFGLPALEAMQLGTPVISSNVSSLPEVVGGAGLLVDPYKTEAIAAAIRAIDSDPELRARLATAGLTQAACFSDAAYRQRLAEMYSRMGLAAQP